MIKYLSLGLYGQFKGLLFSKLVKASSWLFIGGIVAGILGYLFQIIMGRTLSVQEYGHFSALLALSIVLVAPLNTLMMTVARKVSAYYFNKDFGSIAHLYYSINIRILFIALLFVIIGMFYVESIQNYLKISKPINVYILIGIFLVSCPLSVNTGYLQGLKKFKWLSGSGVLNVLIKTIFATILVWVGFGVSGALGGVLISLVIVWLITYIVLRSQLVKGKARNFQTDHITFKTALPVLVANTAFVAMTQMDMVIVQYFFSEYEVGLYAAASILGKAVMYLPGGIAMALFPMVAENDSQGNSSISLLLQALSFTTLMCISGALFYFFFGELIVSFLYGDSYSASGEVLKFYGFAIFPMGLVLIAENYLIAQGKVLFAYLFIIIAPIQLIAIYLYHETLLTVVTMLGISGFTLLFIGLLILWKLHKQQM